MTVIGCDICELPALDVLVTEEFEFVCFECEHIRQFPMISPFIMETPLVAAA